MANLFGIADVIVLVLLLTRVLRAFWKVLPQGAGSIVLVILVACPLICFAMVSFTVYVGFVTEYVSLLSRGIAVLSLVAMLLLLRVTWADQPGVVS
jgi:hypothetical protein